MKQTNKGVKVVSCFWFLKEAKLLHSLMIESKTFTDEIHEL